jgi:Domain of unknown function (DUF4351)
MIYILAIAIEYHNVIRLSTFARLSSDDRVESLGEALLDFTSMADLERFLDG